MAYRYTTTHIVFEVGDKVTPDWIYFEGDDVMTPGREFVITAIMDLSYGKCLLFNGLDTYYEAHMFRLVEDTRVRGIH